MSNKSEKKKSINSTAGKLTVLAQLCKHIPSHVLGATRRIQEWTEGRILLHFWRPEIDVAARN